MEKEKFVPVTKLQNDLLTEKYTEIHFVAGDNSDSPTRFLVIKSNDDDAFAKIQAFAENKNVPNGSICEIKFQDGAIKENGVNGVMNEDLIAMVIARLAHWQTTEFKCRENAVAITKLEESLMWLRKRTVNRERRGVEGTHGI